MAETTLLVQFLDTRGRCPPGEYVVGDGAQEKRSSFGASKAIPAMASGAM
jgi:hypothetical protein